VRLFPWSRRKEGKFCTENNERKLQADENKVKSERTKGHIGRRSRDVNATLEGVSLGSCKVYSFFPTPVQGLSERFSRTATRLKNKG
jgi:hypothetical protein